jgi:Domain of unknown function (DUF222)
MHLVGSRISFDFNGLLLRECYEHVYDSGMLERLREAIEELDLPVDGVALTEGFALLDLLTAKLTTAVRDFDASEMWDGDGATSMTAWLRSHAARSGHDAHALATTARRLRRLPVTAAAWGDGSLSIGQVQAVMANLSPRTLDLFAEHEPAVVPALVGLSVADTAAAMRLWASRAEALVDDPEDAEPDRSLHLSRTLDGRRRLDGDLDPEGGEIVATALRLAQTDDVDGEPARSPARRRADSLVDMCRWFLDHQRGRTGGRHRPHLNVVVDLDAMSGDGFGSLGDAVLLDGSAVQRLLCDAGIHRVITAGRSTILDYGTTTRSIPVSLWNALVVRDGHCRFAGCDRPPDWCEGHHVWHFTDGGPTAIDNLVLGCSRHHHIWHRPGWRVKLLPDGTVETTTPDGRILLSRPPPSNLAAA